MKPVYLAFAFVALATPLVVSPLQAQPVAPLPTVKTRTIQIIGQIQRPGAYELTASGTLASLLMMAGGVTEESALSKVKVYRGKSIFTVNVLDLLKIKTVDFALADRDVVVVPRNDNRVSVSGAVLKPGSFLIPEGRSLSIADALSLAGGLDKSVATKVYCISREASLKKELLWSHQVTNFDQLLQKDDVIYVLKIVETQPLNPLFHFLKFSKRSALSH